MGRAFRVRELWRDLSYAYCRGTEYRLGYAGYLFIEAVLLWAILANITSSFLGPEVGWQETLVVVVFCMIALQGSYFSVVRHRSGYVFHLARLASAPDKRSLLPEERLNLIQTHLESIRNHVNWRADGAFDELLELELRKQNVSDSAKIDLVEIENAIRLDLIHQYASIGKKRVQEPFKRYTDSLLNMVEPDDPIAKSWIAFLVQYYLAIDPEIRKTALGDDASLPELSSVKTTWDKVELAVRVVGVAAALIYAVSQFKN